MIKIISIKSQEQKQDSNGENCFNAQCQVQTDDGGQISAYINSYAGQLAPGDELDIKLEQKTSKKTGKGYWSGYCRPSKQNMTPIKHEDIKVQRPDYTPEEIQGVMDECIGYAGTQIERLKAYGVPMDNITAIINTLFIAHTNRGHRQSDWTVIPKSDPHGGFADPKENERQQMLNCIKGLIGGTIDGTDFNPAPVKPEEF